MLWVCAALRGAVPDLAAARIHSIPERLTRHAVACLADKAYQAAGPTIAVPYKRRLRRGQRTGTALS
jgi:hypothetical protein